MTRLLHILQLFAYEGPNILGPQPGVLLRVRCLEDRSKRLKNALKDGAQFIGMVLANLNVTAEQANDDIMISASFTTPTPTLGSALASTIVEGINAQAAASTNGENGESEGEDESDHDPNAPLFELQQRRRHAALPLPALQLLAEARKRGMPVLHQPDGRVQFGYGAGGWQFDPTAFKAGDDDTAPSQLPTPPWERIHSIPLYVVTGERYRSAMLRQVAAHAHSSYADVRVLDNASYDDTRALLADPTVQCAALALDTPDMLRRGVAFTRCTQSIITDIDGIRPAEAASHDEWAQALGIPMLLSSQVAMLNTAEPAIAKLASYAPHGTVPLRNPANGPHDQS
jgi:hypothetical protein